MCYSCVAFACHTTVSTVRQSYSLHPKTVMYLSAIANLQHRSVSKQLDYIVTEYIKNAADTFTAIERTTFNTLVCTAEC